MKNPDYNKYRIDKFLHGESPRSILNRKEASKADELARQYETLGSHLPGIMKLSKASKLFFSFSKFLPLSLFGSALMGVSVGLTYVMSENNAPKSVKREVAKKPDPVVPSSVGVVRTDVVMLINSERANVHTKVKNGSVLSFRINAPTEKEVYFSSFILKGKIAQPFFPTSQEKFARVGVNDGFFAVPTRFLVTSEKDNTLVFFISNKEFDANHLLEKIGEEQKYSLNTSEQWIDAHIINVGDIN